MLSLETSHINLREGNLAIFSEITYALTFEPVIPHLGIYPKISWQNIK